MEASRTQHRPRLSEAMFDDLVRTHRAPLERFARSLGASREDAEELAATAFLRAYESPPAARHANEWRSWLSTVTRNLWIDTRRRRELRLVRGDGVLDTIPSWSGPLEQVAETAHAARQICAAMALLPPAQRAAIYLREFRGLSYEEIAAELGMTTSVVTATLQRARTTVTQRRGGIAQALSALAVSPLALLRSGARGARLASAPGAAAKIAVPVMLVAGAGGAGVLATTEHASRLPLRAVTSAASTAPASPGVTRALQAGAQAVALPAGARRARRAATPARAGATVRQPAAAESPKATPARTPAGADTGTRHSAAKPAGAAPGTVTHDNQTSGTPRPRTHATPTGDSSAAGAHARRRATGRASPASPRARAPAARSRAPAGGAGAPANGAARASAAPGTARSAANGTADRPSPAPEAPAGPAAPTGNGGTGAPSGTGAPTSTPPPTTAAAAPAGAPPADTPGPAEGQAVGAQAQALPHGQLSGP